MATNLLNARVQLKIDTYANWTLQNPVLLLGEMAIVEIPAGTSGTTLIPPTLAPKVGDGVNSFNDLPWLSAPAADVHAWAKAATKPVYDASEIANLASFIAGKVEDTDTLYDMTTSTDAEKGVVNLVSSGSGLGAGITDTVNFVGSGTVVVSSDASGTVTINSPAYVAPDSGVTPGKFGAASSTTANVITMKTPTVTVDAKGVVTAATTETTTITLPQGSGAASGDYIRGVSLSSDHVLTATTQAAVVDIALNSTSLNLPTTQAVHTYVENVRASLESIFSGSMKFMGSVGTGGTVTTLPTTALRGHTYIVITAGTFAGKTADVGDVFIAMIDEPPNDATGWVHVPAGDEPGGTVTSITVTPGDGLTGGGTVTTSGSIRLDVAADRGLSIVDGKVGHSATSAVGSFTGTVSNMQVDAVTGLTVDAQGHTTAATKTAVVSDPAYVHTENNFSTTLLNKLNGIAEGATANTGTVTSVAVTNGGGLTITGSPITTAGTITVSHGAKPTTGTGQGNADRTYVQNIELDAFGHIANVLTATETVVDTDRYVNTAAFTSTRTGIGMTLTRAGSDNVQVTANIPTVDANILRQTAGDTLILFGGTASTVF